MQISRNIANGSIGFGKNLGYRLRTETISPLFADLSSSIHV